MGKNIYGAEIAILDEQGQKVPDGEQGEICFQNMYFRGYINQPQQTEKVLRDGIFHTGDLGCKDSEGNLIVLGRADDMIKIHGNRVEPGEIEIVAKDVLGVKNIIAKGFKDEGTAFVALYGLASEIGERFSEENLPALRERLGERLPDYMIPTCYMVLDKFPTNANGKVSRKLLPAPKAESPQDGYLPPVTETEAVICQKMAEVLGIRRLGRNSDFYQMGGDSIATIRLVAECDMPGVDISSIYQYPTPQALAAYCDGLEDDSDIPKNNGGTR